MIELVRAGGRNNHVSMDTVKEFELGILADSQVTAVDQANPLVSKMLFSGLNVFEKLGFCSDSRVGKFLANDEKISFSVMMGPNIRQGLPHFLRVGHNNIYLFDAWPSRHEQISHLIRLFGIENIFVSSSQAAALLQQKISFARFHWVPEGIKPDDYRQSAYEKKDIDVISLGRKYDAHHERIVDYLDNSQYRYLYERTKGLIIFPDREDFIVGMARSKISVCVPSNITHPERAGDVETLTIRYFQSMVSKCLILGKAPKELVELFGYNPVIELDMNDPAGQVQALLENYSAYIPLIEKNFEEVVANHTWVNRWKSIKRVLLNT
jgi:hypothetical protein